MGSEAAVFCTKCGQQVAEGSIFCKACGNRLLQPQMPGGSESPHFSKPPLTRQAIYLKAGIAGLIALLFVGGISALLIVALRSSKNKLPLHLPQTQTQTQGNDTQTRGTLSDYVEQMSPVLNGTEAGLQTVDFAALDTTELNDQALAQLQTLSGPLQTEAASLEAAARDVKNMERPDAASQLHSDILGFFDRAVPLVEQAGEASDYLVRMGGPALELQAEMKVVQDQFDSVVTFDQLIPLVDAAYANWSVFLNTLNRLTPPDLLAGYHASLAQNAQDMLGIYTQLRVAASNEDNSSAVQIAIEAQELGDSYHGSFQGALQELIDLGSDYQLLQDELPGLIESLDGLG